MVILKQYGRFILVITVICAILTPGCINNDKINQNSNENWEKIEILYEILINSNTQNNFTVIVPVPLIKDEQMSEKPIDLMQELEINNGEAEMHIQETVHGIGLKINAKNTVNISGYKLFKDEPEDITRNYTFFDLSMKTDDALISQYWLFFSGDNNTVSISIRIYYHYENRGGGVKFDWINKDLKLINGWQKIDLNVERVEYDKAFLMNSS